jgi:hypothetical protein
MRSADLIAKEFGEDHQCIPRITTIIEPTDRCIGQVLDHRHLTEVTFGSNNVGILTNIKTCHSHDALLRQGSSLREPDSSASCWTNLHQVTPEFRSTIPSGLSSHTFWLVHYISRTVTVYDLPRTRTFNDTFWADRAP